MAASVVEVAVIAAGINLYVTDLPVAVIIPTFERRLVTVSGNTLANVNASSILAAAFAADQIQIFLNGVVATSFPPISTTPVEPEPDAVPVVAPAPVGTPVGDILTGGSAKTIIRGAAKGTTPAGDVTSTAEGPNHHALDVQIYSGGGAVNPTAIRALTAADVVTALPGATFPVSGPVTDAQLRATPVPVSISSDIQIGAVELKNGTDDTRATVTAANALKVDGSAVTQPVSAASLPLPVGAATEATLIAVDVASTRTDTYTAAVAGVILDVSAFARESFAMQVTATGAVTSWTVVLEGSLDGATFTTILTHTNVTPGNGFTLYSGEADYPSLYFRSRCSAIVLGTGTNVVVQILGVE